MRDRDPVSRPDDFPVGANKAVGEEKHQPIRDTVNAAKAATEEQDPQVKGSTSPPPPEPPEGAKVIKIWRTEDGKVYLNDADLGPGPTFDLLNWAQLTVKMPFFYREMSSELIRLVSYTMKQIDGAIHNHEIKCHGTEDKRPKDATKDAHPDDTSASPEVPEAVQRDDPESQLDSPTGKS